MCRELFPNAKRLAVLSSVESMSQLRTFIEEMSNRFGFELRWVEYAPKDLEAALISLHHGSPDVAYVTASAVASTNRQKIVDFLEEARIPTTYPGREYVEAGGFLSFSVSLPDLARRGADYVHRILQRERPSDLPVERPLKYELLINLKAARRLAVTIPPSILVQADEVIE
jgi:putative ABC transport system substrate-binding protein